MASEEIMDPARRLFLRAQYELLNEISLHEHALNRAEDMIGQLFDEFPELAARWADREPLARYQGRAERQMEAHRAQKGA